MDIGKIAKTVKQSLIGIGETLARITHLPYYIAYVENWPDVYLAGLFLKRATTVCRLKNGMRFVTRPAQGDVNPIREVLLDRCYDVEGYIPKKGEVVIDVGCHIGAYSVLAAKKGADVYAFEPNPETYDVLKQNIRLNNVGTIRAEDSAVTGKNGAVNLNLGRYCYGDSVVWKRPNSMEVKSTTLSSIIERYKIKRIGILKMDCEGSEYDILDSMAAGALEKTDRIIVEYHFVDGKRNRAKVIEFLKKNGFVIDKVTGMGRGLIFARTSFLRG